MTLTVNVQEAKRNFSKLLVSVAQGEKEEASVMTTTTIEREELVQIVRNLPDDKVKSVLNLIQELQDEGHEPNEETIKILEDSEAGRNLLGPYDTLDDMFKDFGINVDAQPDYSVQK
jgi:predicted  nucleic acid-binding Zn-ribbon protein